MFFHLLAILEFWRISKGVTLELRRVTFAYDLCLLNFLSDVLYFLRRELHVFGCDILFRILGLLRSSAFGLAQVHDR
jgi:hypothetical protein